ncbi:NACHT domain-containing protein [Lewinella sp. LCG006]|uniref:NACHT domain-containing protein n=1 Tax=Lewinella sp. LCG006 TaxID=3231911 RepID=UPI0034603D53
MKNRLKPLLTFFGLLVIIIIVSLVPELVGGDLADSLKGKLGKNYHYIIIGVGLLALLAYTYWSEADGLFGKKVKETPLENVSQDNLQKIRSSLLESYQKRIDSKLASRFPIELEVTYTREGSPTKGHIYNKSLRISDLKKELIEIFDQQRGRLLIIGEPGAGKTTLLLQLAIKLLERDEAQIPFIINIATWRSRFSSVEKWLLELLPQMGFSKALARQMITEQRLLLLLDGLDEVAEEERSVFLNAVANYGKSNQARFVICSRIREYTDTVDAPVNGQVMVNPLTLTQIEQGLKDTASPEANGLLDAIAKDALLAKVLIVPFYLNTIQLLFASKKVLEEFKFTSNKIVKIEQEIIAAFVDDATNKLGDYSREQVRKWLAFLASRMNRYNLVDVELSSFQYHWCNLNEKQILSQSFVFFLIASLSYSLTLSLLFGLCSGLISCLLTGLASLLFSGLLYGLYFGFVVWLALGLAVGLVVGLFGMIVKGIKKRNIIIAIQTDIDIETKDKLVWSPSLLKISFKNSFRLILVAGLIAGLVFGIAVGFTINPIAGLVAGLVTSLVSSLVHILVRGLGYILDSNRSYLKIHHPYQRFYASMWSLHFSIIQHFHLRYILYKKGLLPWRLVDFLNEATKNNILESDGGSWRFRHRILQDYFAKHWEDVYAETEDGHQKQEEG